MALTPGPRSILRGPSSVWTRARTRPVASETATTWASVSAVARANVGRAVVRSRVISARDSAVASAAIRNSRRSIAGVTAGGGGGGPGEATAGGKEGGGGAGGGGPPRGPET